MKIPTFRFPTWTIFIFLFGLGIASFGLLIPQLGFYWDDWETVLVGRLFPPSEYWTFFSSNRPTAALSYYLLAPLLGFKALHWQVFTLMIRCLSAVLLFVTVNSIWEDKQRQAALTACLFLVYPVFIQQPISVTYHQIWLHYIFFFLSLWLMVVSVKNGTLSRWKRIICSTLAVIFMGLNLSISEYFIGMELVRPVLLFMVLPIEIRVFNRLKKVAVQWIPYLLPLFGFVAWRLIAYQNVQDAPNTPVLLLQLISDPFPAVQKLLQYILQDIILTLGSSWYKTLDPVLINLSSKFMVASWGLVAAVFLGCVIFLTWYGKEKPKGSTLDEPDRFQMVGQQSRFTGQALTIALVALLAGPLPVWITDKQAAVGFYSNRFALTAMFGASLLIVVSLEWMVKNWKQKVIIVSLLCGLAAGLHFRVANDFRWSWAKQSRFYWQLFWRAPDIQPHTPFVSDGTVLPYVNPTLSLNVLYLQPRSTRELAFYYFGLGNNVKTWLRPQLLEGYSREFPFSAKSSDSLVFFYNPPNCLWILDSDDQKTPDLPGSIRDVLINSNPSRILEDPASPDYPPVDVFGTEEEHGWCYSYEKSELAGQYRHWDEVIRIGENAIQEGYLAGTSPFEWLPLVEAYAVKGRLDDALEITQKNLNKDPLYQGRYCDLWEQIGIRNGDPAAVKTTIEALNCP